MPQDLIRRASVLEILEGAGAVLTNDHFVYTKGGHGPVYVAKDDVFPDPIAYDRLGMHLASAILEQWGAGVDTIIAPATAGVGLVHSVGRHLARRNGKIRTVYADKEGAGLIIRRGYGKHVRGKRVVGVEDIVNSGGSLHELGVLVRENDGDLLGMVAICNRGPSTAKSLGVPFFEALVEVEADNFPASDCPLCRAHVPINTEYGHGRKYVEEHGQP